MRTSFLMALAPAALCLIVSGCGGASSSTGGGGGGGQGGGGGGTPTTVTVSFLGTPAALATQIGSGAYTAATLTSGKLTLSIPSGTTNFAVAYLCQISSSTQQTVIEASTLDGSSFTAPFCPSTATVPTGTLSGSADASAIAGANFVGVTANNGGGVAYQPSLSAGTSVTLNDTVQSGTDRVAVSAYEVSTPVTFNSAETLLAVRNFDGVVVPGAVNGGKTVTLGAADAVTLEPIAYKNVPSGFPSPTTSAYYEWSDGGQLLLSTSETTQYPAIPVAATESGDYYSFESTIEISTGGGGSEEGVSVSTNTTANGPLTLAFPAPWIYAGPTPSAQPVFNMANSGITSKTGVTDYLTLVWNSTPAGGTDSELIATGNYLNGSTSLAFPNLAGLSGFLSGPPSGSMVVWFASISQSSAASLQPLNQNGTETGVENGGSFTVP